MPILPNPDPPAYPWLPLSAVLTHLRVAADAPQAGAVELARAAAAAYVERVRPADYTATVGADVVFGAVLLAARFYSRQGSPGGIASYGEFGAAAVLRFDPDVAQLLGLGRHARPRIG